MARVFRNRYAHLFRARNMFISKTVVRAREPRQRQSLFLNGRLNEFSSLNRMAMDKTAFGCLTYDEIEIFQLYYIRREKFPNSHGSRSPLSAHL